MCHVDFAGTGIPAACVGLSCGGTFGVWLLSEVCAVVLRCSSLSLSLELACCSRQGSLPCSVLSACLPHVPALSSS